MKTITKKYKVFTFEELSQEAKDKARESFNEEMDYPFLTDDLREYIHEELEEAGYKEVGVSTSANPSIVPYYSLSYSQGDGLMFEGTFEDKDGNYFTTKQSGHYYHSGCTDITGTDQEGNEIYDDNEAFKKFKEVYEKICDTVEKRGYDEIEYQESEEAFAETCEANEFTFLEDGTIFNG